MRSRDPERFKQASLLVYTNHEQRKSILTMKISSSSQDRIIGKLVDSLLPSKIKQTNIYEISYSAVSILVLDQELHQTRFCYNLTIFPCLECWVYLHLCTLAVVIISLGTCSAPSWYPEVKRITYIKTQSQRRRSRFRKRQNPV